MRMIDADALKDRLQTLSYDDWNQGVPTTWASAFAVCADIVEAMPTFEPERKKGKWLELDFAEAWEYKCDQCGRLSDFEENFCPWCGARMEDE